MFEKFVETINNTGKAVGEKARQGSDIAKASIKITAEEKALTDIYTEIGKLYFDNHKDNPCCEEMKALCDKAAEKIASLEGLKAQVRAIKGVNVCANCGADVPLENDFCGKCGAKIDRPEPAPETPEEVIDHEDTVEGAADIKIEVDPDSED